MIARQLLAKLNESGVKLTIDNGKLSYKEADSHLTPQLLQQIRSMNDELIDLVRDSDQVGQNEVELTEDRLQTLRSYWKSALPGDLKPIDLPFDHARTSVHNTNGGTVDLQMKADIAETLRTRAREEDCTLLIALMAALKTLLHRYSQHKNIIVGTPVQCGGDTQSAVETGGRTNILPIGTNFAGKPTFRDILRRERDAFQQALQYKDLPFHEIVEAVQPRSEAGCHPIFQIALTLRSKTNSDQSDTQNAMSPDNDTSQYDLVLKLTESESGLSGAIEFDKSFFDETTIERFLQNFETLIGAAIVKPDAPIRELCILSEQRRDLILHQWNDTDCNYPADVTLMKMFEAQVDRTPDTLALISGDTELTYAEFDRRSNQLARYLVKRGVGPEMPVGLFLERSTEMLVGIYGILKAGGAYMPLDPDLPSERISFMLEESKISVVLSQAHLLAELPAELPAVVSLDGDWDKISAESNDRLPLRAAPDNLAYVIYTSGSTGHPKGVMIEHRAICNREHWVLEEYGFGSDDVVIQKFPFGFDASVCELFTPLLCGARLVIATPGGHRDSQYLTQQIIKHGITTIQIVPSMLELLIEDGSIDQCKTLRRVLCGGEALTHALHNRFSRHLPNCQLHNMYGPTEATVNVTSWACQKNDEHRTIPIGLPIANTQIYILDKYLQPVPIGASGELYVGGVQLARGYLNRPDLTRERFIPNPFADGLSGQNSLLYRTGDLCRFLPDGSIDYLARIDSQVKVRGLRIELGEIETAVAESADPPLQAVVEVWCPEPSDARLVAYIETKKVGDLDLVKLREKLRSRLPEYMIPQHFVELAEFPKTTSGKIDRKRLPEPVEAETDREIVPAKSRKEELLFKVWREILGLNTVSRTDNFFDCGGHSLLGMKLIGRIEKEFGTRLSFRSLLQGTLADMAEQLPEASLEQAGYGKIPILQRNEAGIELALPQEPFWLLHKLNPDNVSDHMWFYWTIEGPLHRAALQGAFDAIVRRHESLRLHIDEHNGTGLLRVEEPFVMPVEIHSLHDVEPEMRDAQQRRICTDALRRPFDFSSAPLFRLVLIEVDSNRHVLFCVMQHIIGDGLSMGMLQTELAEHYAAFCETGEPAQFPDLQIQYLDFAMWQRFLLTEKRTKELQDYWKSVLPANLPALELPADHPRPALQTFEGNSVAINLSKQLAEAIRKRGKTEGCSLFVMLTACLKILLHRMSGQNDVVLGIPVALRDIAELADMVGLLTNTLPVRTNFSGDRTFREILQLEQNNFIEALDHKDLPFHQIVRAVEPLRDPSRNPLFQIMIEMMPGAEINLPELSVGLDRPEGGGAQFDLAFHLSEGRDGIKGFVQFNRDLFKANTVERLVESFKTVIHAVVDNPDLLVSKIPLLSETEQHIIRHDWNATGVDFPEGKGLHQHIAEQVKRRPAATALVFEDRVLSYAELDLRANQLANHLRTLGVGPDVMVGLCVERSLELIVGALGILKAGGAYIPMDPAYPKQRLAYMLEDTQAEVILTNNHLVDDLPAHQAKVLRLDSDWEMISKQDDQAPLADQFRSNQLAYVIFTSGSTGRPKGVMVEHRNISNFFTAMDGAIYPDRSSEEICGDPGTWLAVTSLSFDISVLELFWTLARGFKVVVFDEGSGHEQSDDKSIPALIASHGITHMQCVPAMARMMLSDDGGKKALYALDKLLIGGEAFPGPLATDLKEHVSGDVINMYGPTETTVWSSTYPASNDCNTVPIGKPVANTQFYVLDENQEPVPIGVPGELYIGGAGVSRGYVGRPDLTQERFVPNRFDPSGGCLYRTGDRVAYRPDGILEYLGRLDFQVKVRGFRIELGEIETAIAQFTNMNTPVVVNAWSPHPSDVRLVAYFETGAASELVLDELRDKLRNRLPEYMVPQHFVELAAFPKTSNGKIDRKQLPAPELKGRKNTALPATAVEKEMAKLWQHRLRAKGIGRSDSFFDLGGHSLSAVQLAADIGKTFKIPFSPRNLLEQPRLEEISRRVEQLLAQNCQTNQNSAATKNLIAEEPSHSALQLSPPSATQPVGVQDSTSSNTQRRRPPRRHERWWKGFKNRLLQIIALYAPGMTTLRVKLHRARGVRIGDNVSIGVGALIETSSPHLVDIGNNVQVGIRTTFIGHFGEMASGATSPQPTIRVEDDVYIGPGVIVLPNVTIGRGSVVTAGSVVNTSVPPTTVIQGNPAVPVAKCKVPLAWNSYSEYMKNLEPLGDDNSD